MSNIDKFYLCVFLNLWNFNTLHMTIFIYLFSGIKTDLVLRKSSREYGNFAHWKSYSSDLCNYWWRLQHHSTFAHRLSNTATDACLQQGLFIVNYLMVQVDLILFYYLNWLIIWQGANYSISILSGVLT